MLIYMKLFALKLGGSGIWQQLKPGIRISTPIDYDYLPIDVACVPVTIKNGLNT